MSNELARYVSGDLKPSRENRPIARAARQVAGEVMMAGFKADGLVALSAHMMEQTLMLDQHRRSLAGDDPIMNQMLVEIEVEAVRQLKSMQGQLFSTWKL